MTSIHDVAKSAQVSIATVSRVLNGDSSVHPGLQVLVNEAVAKLDYRPNAVARSLRLSKSGMIGVVVSDLSNPIFIRMLHGIQATAREKDVSVVLCDAGGPAADQRPHLERLYAHRVDGLILHPTGPYREAIEPFARAGTPVVVIGQREPSGNRLEVVVDESAASREAYRHLLALGHRRIALILQRPGAEGEPAPTSAQESRSRAYRAAHAEYGVAVDETLIVSAADAQAATLQVRSLFSRADRPTALVSAVHPYTPEFLRELQQMGLRVPETVSFISYGDTQWAAIHTPAITVVRSDYEAYGRQAATLLFSHDPTNPETQTLRHAAEFISRESCAPCPGTPG